MAISFIANALGGTTTTTSFTITLPTTQLGDILILEYVHRGTANGTLGGTSITTDGLTSRPSRKVLLQVVICDLDV